MGKQIPTSLEDKVLEKIKFKDSVLNKKELPKLEIQEPQD
jgi:hypothetical protein